jgi:hypothetical protein
MGRAERAALNEAEAVQPPSLVSDRVISNQPSRSPSTKDIPAALAAARAANNDRPRP